MSTLATLLAAKEPLFELALKQLEDRTDRQGVDAALTGEIITKVAQKTIELGLDPDCTGPELYDALIKKVAAHDKHLVKKIGGGDDPADVAKLLPIVAEKAKHLKLPKTGFFLKPEVAAAMLERHQPPGILDRLGYSKVSTMLAHESLDEIYVALRFAEEADWLSKFDETYRSLTAADFETRDIKLLRFDNDKWGDIAADFIKGKFHNITHSKEMGVIGMMPMLIERMPGIVLKDISLVAHYTNEIRLYSAFFKLMRHKKNFGHILADTLIADPSHVSIMKGIKVHWRVIQRYFGKHPQGHPEIFQPHLQPEDLHWRRAEEVLYDLDPELGFWRDLDYVAVVKGSDDDIVTFNWLDVAFSYSNELSYADRYIYHFRESLWNEVFARYMGQRTLEEQLLIKLDNDLIAPEELRV